MTTPSLKPPGPQGETCPLREGADCSRVCQSCHFWTPLELEERGRVVLGYNCAIKWAALSGAASNTRLAALQVAQEGLRNRFEAFRRSVLGLVAVMGKINAVVDGQPIHLGELTADPDPPPQEMLEHHRA